MSNQKESIQVPWAPKIKGLTFRRFKDSSDFPKMVEVANKSWEADKAKWKISEVDLSLEFGHPINFSPKKDVLLAEIDGEIVGYSRLYWFKKPEKIILYKHYTVLHPEWRESGIWPVMLGFCEKRASEIAKQMAPALKHYCEAWAATEENDWKTLLEGNGYEPSWFLFEMVRYNLDDVPDMPLPKGIEVRQVKPEQHSQIWEASQEALRDERTYSEDKWSDEAYKKWLSNPLLQPHLWQVAWEKDEVVGGIHNYINEKQNLQMNRKWGWTERIFVRRDWRKRGIAKALIAKSLKVLREHGMEAAALGVDTENPSGALKLYESMGYEINNQFTFYRKQVE